MATIERAPDTAARGRTAHAAIAPYPTAVRHHPALRQSVLAGAADCGLHAGYMLRMAIPKPGENALHTSGWTTHRQACGRLVHETLALALRHMVEHEEEQIAPEMILDIWDDVLRQADVPVEEMFALPAHEDKFARWVLRKWARENTFTIADIYGIEERFEATVTYPDGAGGVVERVLTGQLDLLLVDPSGVHATVVDDKMTWALPPSRHDENDPDDDGEDDALSAEGYFQQRFYAAVLLLKLPALQSVTLREYYLPRSQAREATIWRHELPNLIAYFSALAEKFDRSYEAAIVTRRGRLRRRPLATPAQWGEPSPGQRCDWCPGAMDCPVPVEARDGGMIRSPAEAQTVAGILLRAKKVVKMTEASLRTWTDREGPVRVRDAKRDHFLGYAASERVERPTLRQVDAAMLAGRDPRSLYRRKTSTRFSDYSPDADVSRGLDDADVLSMFERAAEMARRKNRPRTRA